MHNKYSKYTVVATLCSFGCFAQKVISQSMKALTAVLSICNFPAPLTPTELTPFITTSSSARVRLLEGKSSIAIENVQDMVSECSHHKASFSTYIVPYTIQIPCDYNSELACNTKIWSDMVDNTIKLNSPEINIYDYPYHIYILPENVPCGFTGQTELKPCSPPYCKIFIKGLGASKPATYLHELGHNLGLKHAWHDGDEYGDMSSAMGYCCNTRCFNSVNTDLLNWTMPNVKIDFTDIMTSQTEVYTLRPNEYIYMIYPNGNPTFIQYRKVGIGYDIDIPERFSDCVNIYQSQVYDRSYSYFLQALCKPYDFWYTEYNSYSVMLLEKTDTYARIKISRLM